VHAPGDVTDAAALLFNNKVVFGSAEDVLEPGCHNQGRWEELSQFETTWLS
jgi:hypothetical protein